MSTKQTFDNVSSEFIFEYYNPITEEGTNGYYGIVAGTPSGKPPPMRLVFDSVPNIRGQGATENHHYKVLVGEMKLN